MRKYAKQAISGLTNIGPESPPFTRHQRSINFNPQLSKIKVRRDHGDMDHDDDHLGDQADLHQGGEADDHQGGHDHDHGDLHDDMDSR